jgi:ribulose 1,5-bisphosphate synthetase/thiazole synthase
MNTLPATTEVVIVGAGPTGLTVACTLAKHGVQMCRDCSTSAGPAKGRAGSRS